MSPIEIAVISIFLLFIFVLAGVHVAYALGFVSLITICVIKGSIPTGISLLATTAYAYLRNYSLAVIPLFVLMGCFMSRSGAAKDLFDTMYYGLKKIPGGMGIATILSNAVFAAITGVSIASASVFSKISLPAMKSYNYDRYFALGAVAGSSVLGMLIPPSLLFIIYGTIGEVSIGDLFIAGIIPGLILTGIYCTGVTLMALRKPQLAGGVLNPSTQKYEFKKAVVSEEPFLPVFLRSLPIFIIIIVVLGGIWGGWFTTTEASAVGAMLTFLLSLIRGMRWKNIKLVLIDAGGSTASIMFLLIVAQMYSRMLTLSGITNAIKNTIADAGWASFQTLLVFLLIWLILGCMLDATSILLITIPLMLPIAITYGWNLVWFGVVAVIVIEMGFLTPPFGLTAFVIKASVAKDDEYVTVEGVFKGGVPYLFMMAITVALIIAFPDLATWLPDMR